jgi:hypothetical protein
MYLKQIELAKESEVKYKHLLPQKTDTDNLNPEEIKLIQPQNNSQKTQKNQELTCKSIIIIHKLSTKINLVIATTTKDKISNNSDNKLSAKRTTIPSNNHNMKQRIPSHPV